MDDKALLAALDLHVEGQQEYRFGVRRQKVLEALRELDKEWEADWLVLEEEWAA